MSQPLLSLAESKALRGIAILGIVLHNYCHFLGFAVKENEYTFNVAKPMMLWDRLMAPDQNLFVHIMSFFGHYGVPVFLFISGFGLVCKYEQKTPERVRAVPFVGYHYLKLLRLMFLGYVAFAVVSYLHPHGYHGYTAGRVVAQLLMYINILPTRTISSSPAHTGFSALCSSFTSFTASSSTGGARQTCSCSLPSAGWRRPFSHRPMTREARF